MVFLVSRFQCTLWFLIISHVSYDLNVLVAYKNWLQGGLGVGWHSS